VMNGAVGVDGVNATGKQACESAQAAKRRIRLDRGT
jgi:hypothetical protein